jgi:hypothetical protein
MTESFSHNKGKALDALIIEDTIKARMSVPMYCFQKAALILLWREC